MATLEELRRRFEDLALEMVVGRPEESPALDAWSARLARLQEDAAEIGASDFAAAAGAALDHLGAGGEETGSGSVREALAAVQRLLESEPPCRPANLAPPAQDPELVADFVLESREHLAAIEAQALALERNPLESEALHAVFRGFHSIKGLAGFLELWELQRTAHEIETVLDVARNGQLTLTPAAIDVILQGADYLKSWIEHVEAGLQRRPSDAPAPNEPLLHRIRSLTVTAENPPAEPQALASLCSAIENPPPAAEPATAPAAPASDRGRRESMSVKVDTAKLDYLVDMAGEMVIAESLVRHDRDLAALNSAALQRKIAQLTRITAELQKTAMSMRLVPIGPLFRRMARLVRDLSRQFGKSVELETQGDQIELDRTIVEELADPFMHMVRNAIDHGIESSDERRTAGKPLPARLLLRAQHQAGQVVIEIADDGRGLDPEKIQAKALERGLISSAEGLAKEDTYNLIFLPGFSTASNVTKVSGRGVGMDVVRRHIERLRGRIEVRSSLGCGTSFQLKLPLTLAIIDGLVVGVGKERYIVPLFAIREMLRPKAENIWTVKGQAEMALIRGELLPMIRLYRRFGVSPATEDPLNSVLIVAEVEGEKFCFLVDEALGKQEVVIKSLGETFRGVSGIAGAAILGDGRVGLILDLDRLFAAGDR